MDYPLIKYPFIWIMAVLFLLFSCKDHDNVDKGGDGIGEVEMYFASPKTYATLTGSPEEQRIEELDILVFKGDRFRYRRIGTKSTNSNSFRSTLRVDQGLTIYLFANCRSIIENCNALNKTDNDNPDLDGEKWEDIRKELILTGGSGLNIADGLPMWGVAENITIVDHEVNQLGIIPMLRSVVSVDVICEVLPAAFDLVEAYLFFVPDKGLIAPDKDNLGKDSSDNLIVTKAESPTGMQTTLKRFANTVDNNKIAYQLYSYENEVSKGQTNETRRFTRLVVGGRYNGSSNTTYYPVDFYNDGVTEVEPILRNTKYQIKITDVTSEGFPDENIASEEFDSRMEYSVVPWQDGSQEVIFDGPYYVSLESRYANLARTKGFYIQLDFTTNIPEEDLEMTLDDTYGSNTPIMEGTKVIGYENSRFNVKYVYDNGKLAGLLFTTKDVFQNNDPYDNQQVLTIKDNKRKRIEVKVYIQQLDRSPADWIDGGGYPSEIGEED